MSRRTFSRLMLCALSTYAICALWPSAPTCLILLDQAVPADAVVGLALGAFLTRRG